MRCQCLQISEYVESTHGSCVWFTNIAVSYSRQWSAATQQAIGNNIFAANKVMNCSEAVGHMWHTRCFPYSAHEQYWYFYVFYFILLYCRASVLLLKSYCSMRGVNTTIFFVLAYEWPLSALPGTCPHYVPGARCVLFYYSSWWKGEGEREISQAIYCIWCEGGRRESTDNAHATYCTIVRR